MKDKRMTKITWKPGTMLAPVPPVMITCGTMEQANVFTVAWTGIINSEPPMTYISVRPSRHSHSIIKESGEFVINLTTLELAKACDYCGVKSGKDTDKFKDMDLEIEPCSQVKAPMLVKAPIALECRVQSITSMNTHDMFIAEIVNVNVDDKYIEEDGRLALEKAGLLAFVHGRYYTLGRDLGAFGFSVDKTKENKTKPRKSKFAELLRIEDEVQSEVKQSAEKIKRGAPHRERKFDDREGSERKPRRSNSESFSGERRPRRPEGEGYSGERRPRRPEGEGYSGERRPRRPEGEGYSGERRPRRPEGERYSGERRPRRPEGERYSGERRPRRPEGEGYSGERRAPRHHDNENFRGERNSNRSEHGFKRDFSREDRSGSEGKRPFKKAPARGGRSGGKPPFKKDGHAPSRGRRSEK